MVAQHAQKLACELVTSHFGDLVGKVCSCLIYRGNLTLPEIARFTELSPGQLKNCLLVLVQHNCVQAFKVEQEGTLSAPARVLTQYVVFVDYILHRMRFPKFLGLLREHLGEESHKSALVAAEQIETEEQRIIAAAAPLEGERFLLPSSMEHDTPTERGNEDSIPTSKVGEKRKYESLKTDTNTMTVVDDKEVLWRANYEEFIRRLRHKAVRTTTEGRTMTVERIRASLNQMASDSVGFLSRAGDMGGQYVIYLYKIIEVARRSEISDQALVGRKETLELLYKLLKDGYLQLQEIAKSQDHAPSKTFYLWRVNSSSLMERIIDDMYHAASNLGKRLASNKS